MFIKDEEYFYLLSVLLLLFKEIEWSIFADE